MKIKNWIFTDENILGVLQQILRLLVASVHRDEFDLLQVYDHAIFAQEHVSCRSGPEKPGVSAAEGDTAGQGGPRGSDRSPLASSSDAGPGPRTLKRSAIQQESLDFKEDIDLPLFFTCYPNFSLERRILRYFNKHQMDNLRWNIARQTDRVGRSGTSPMVGVNVHEGGFYILMSVFSFSRFFLRSLKLFLIKLW